MHVSHNMFTTTNKIFIPLRRNVIVRLQQQIDSLDTIASKSYNCRHIQSNNNSSINVVHTSSYNNSYSTTANICALPERHGTTILCVRKNDKVCMIGDSMVSQGSMIVKPNAIKIRRIVPKSNNITSSSSTSSSSSNDSATPTPTEVTTTTTSEDSETTTTTTTSNDSTNNATVTIVGFAGSTADAFTLMERLENKLEEYPGQLIRSCVELAKGWRTDKYLRRLEASLIVSDCYHSFELTGNGDVLESHDGILGVGSGSPYAIAAARALIDIPELDAEQIAHKAMKVASDMCVYTNDKYTVEVLEAKEPPKE